MPNTGDIRIVFFGTPDYVVPVLDGLVKARYHIALVCTQPDRPVGRKQILSPSPIKEYANKQNILVTTPQQIDEQVIEHVRSLRPHIAVLAAYGLILPQMLLDIPTHGFVNIHPSLLPQYRGATPVQAAIRDGIRTTGVSIMKIDHKMDHGPIIASREVSLLGKEQTPELLRSMFVLGTELLIQTLPKYIDGSLQLQEQDHTKATFTALLKKQDGMIDWSNTAEQIERQIRAMAGWPGTFTLWNGLRLQIIQARVFEKTEASDSPGAVAINGNSVVVSCGCGQLELQRVKLAGKNEMSSTDFVQGMQDFKQAILE